MLNEKPLNKGSVLRIDRISHGKMNTLDKEKTLVLATMSPIEVHGPHLPLGQDLFEAYAVAVEASERAAKKMPEWTFLLLPPVPVATDCVPKLGSVSFPVASVRDVAYRLLEPFAKAGFTRLAYSSFHGGPRHICAMESAAEELSKKYDLAAVCLFSVVLARIMEGDVFFQGIENTPGRTITKEELKKDHHAGFVETSFGLHLWPELIEEDWQSLPTSVAEAELGEEENDSFLYGADDQGKLTKKLDHLKSQVTSIYRSMKHFTSHTYFGYPGKASAEEGRDMFDHINNIATDALVEFIQNGTDMEVHSPLWKMHNVLLSPIVNKIADDWLKLYND